jgi:PDZ domain
VARLTFEAKERYPRFLEWLRKDFVHVLSNQRIMKAFWRWSAFTDSLSGRLHFKYGFSPTIDLLDNPSLPVCTYNPDGTPSGVFYAKTFNAEKIFINPVLAKLLVSVLAAEDDAKPSTEGRLFPAETVTGKLRALRPANFRRDVIQLVECTILHEMVHWSYFVKGVDEAARYAPFGGDIEYGTKQFELEAYGSSPTLPLKYLCENKSPFAYLGIVSEQKLQDARTVLVVTAVKDGSPAGKAGIRLDDVITDFDGQGIWPEGFSEQLRKKKPGDRVRIKGYRGSKIEFAYDVILGSHPVDK